jgi:hypothetical protein
VQVKYEELKGWETDITSAKSFDDLPENAQKYVQFIEDFVGIKVQYIGVGYVYSLFCLFLTPELHDQVMLTPQCCSSGRESMITR